MWNITTGKCLLKIQEHNDAVICLKLKENLLVTGCADGLVRIFNVSTGKRLISLTGHTRAVQCLHFDGNRIISASQVLLQPITYSYCNHNYCLRNHNNG